MPAITPDHEHKTLSSLLITTIVERCEIEREMESELPTTTPTPLDALVAWRALIDGRWSLLDRFDKDGRRFLLARENDPSHRTIHAFTRREREIACRAVLGQANKRIAYDLALPQSTVSTTLRLVAAKLGARSRIDLVRLLAQPPPPLAAGER